ncbi:MAG TPA: short-chain dehydrogenase, partial [Alcanivorax sp.]|nr:short-chain dehydrogenase [Alcanivorax sp.]
MANRLANKITVITGATSGIGEATARRFIEEGATVVLAGRSEEKGEALAKELGERAVFKRTDIMSEDDIAALVDFTVEKFGRLDCLFNNAGAG